jgi:acyl carrier protein
LFEGGLGVDSIAIVELISLVEQHFDFQFSDAELTPESFSTLNVLANIIANKMVS